MELKKLWDENSEEAQEIHGVASLIYGDDHIVVFDKYFLVLPSKDDKFSGKLVDCEGNLVRENISCLIPLILRQNQLPVAWAIMDKATEEMIQKARAAKIFYRAVNNLRKIDSWVDEQYSNEDILGRMARLKQYIDVIIPDGSIAKAELLNANREDLKLNGNIYYKVYKGIDGYQYMCNT